MSITKLGFQSHFYVFIEEITTKISHDKQRYYHYYYNSHHRHRRQHHRHHHHRGHHHRIFITFIISSFATDIEIVLNIFGYPPNNGCKLNH